jgi:hypothetical protein
MMSNEENCPAPLLPLITPPPNAAALVMALRRTEDAAPPSRGEVADWVRMPPPAFFPMAEAETEALLAVAALLPPLEESNIRLNLMVPADVSNGCEEELPPPRPEDEAAGANEAARAECLEGGRPTPPPAPLTAENGLTLLVVELFIIICFNLRDMEGEEDDEAGIEADSDVARWAREGG